jgi:nucleotide-binding universal stress UspA family protein
MKDLNKIVIPIDLDKNSQKIVDLAILMATKMGSEICFFHSFDFIESDSMSQMGSQKYSYGDYNTKKSDNAKKIIEEFIKKASSDFKKYSIDVVVGDVVQSIVNFAGTQNADMIIMGTHGKQTQDKILLGSNAEQVLRIAKCPVLVANPYR